ASNLSGQREQQDITERADLSPIRPWERDTDDGREEPTTSDGAANVLHGRYFYGSGDAAEPGYDWDVGESGYASYRS
ncbi:hypothetical protein LTS18_001500, partial [Coniosporium uncinatum]